MFWKVKKDAKTNYEIGQIMNGMTNLKIDYS